MATPTGKGALRALAEMVSARSTNTAPTRADTPTGGTTGGDTARLYSSNSFIGEIMADMRIPRPKTGPDSTEEIFVPLSAEQILQGDAGLVMVSAFTPAGAEGDTARAQQEKFQSNPLWKKLKGEVVAVDDATFLASVSIQGAHAVITDLAKHYGVDPHLP